MSTEKSPATAGQAAASSPMKRRGLVAILIVVVLCVAAWFLTSPLRNGGTEQASTTTSTTASETAAAEPTTTAEAATTTEPTSDSTNEAAVAPTTQAPAPDTNATEPTPAPEAEPTEDAAASPLNTTTADRAPLTGSAPLIQQLPAPASGGQTLVAGFPTDIMGPVDGTTVAQNTVTVEGSTMQVSLTGRTSASPEEISRHYAELWASLGLSPQPGSDNGSLSATSDFDWASLTFNPVSDGGVEYTVYGFFRTS